MPRKINEDVVAKAIDLVFDWIKDGREEALRDKFKRDPKLVALTDELAVLRNRIDRYFRQNG